MNFSLTNLKKRERVGELFIVAETALCGLFPIIAGYVTRQMPPIFFAGVVNVVAGICMFIYLFFTGQFRNFLNKKAWPYILGLTVFIVIIPSILIFIGASKTSSINLSILLQTELFFTFLICGFILGMEKINPQKIIGALTVLIGATVVLYNGSMEFKWGDIFIVAGTLFYPIGNIFSKKALGFTTPIKIIFTRSIIGGLFLIAVSAIFETHQLPATTYIQNNLLNILISGVVVFAIAKIFWYEGLKRIDISKAISIAISMPAFSLAYSAIFLRELPTIYQILGFFVVLTGLIILTRQKSSLVL